MGFVLQGKHTFATVHTDNVNEETMGQIIQICNIESLAGSKIHIMPDCHKSKDCVVGTTLTYTDSVIPSMVGTDIGCGMLLAKLEKHKVTEDNLQSLDAFLKCDIAKVTDKIRGEKSLLDGLTLKIDASILQSFATLGSGNHFIEMAEDSSYMYIVIHTGSRWLGSKVAEHHINIAYKENLHKLPANQSHLKGIKMQDYLNDLVIAQHFASENRKAILFRILKQLNIENNLISFFESEHNYIDVEQKILHKGSCSAKSGELVIIPINMREGSLLGVGLGNDNWNQSAPHGAGRLLSRSQAKEILSLDEFRQQMKHVWSSSINQSMISEAPNAYKSMLEIQENVSETITIFSIIKPFYNFKNN